MTQIRPLFAHEYYVVQVQASILYVLLVWCFPWDRCPTLPASGLCGVRGSFGLTSCGSHRGPCATNFSKLSYTILVLLRTEVWIRIRPLSFTLVIGSLSI
jgi:hypothetical protein